MTNLFQKLRQFFVGPNSNDIQVDLPNPEFLNIQTNELPSVSVIIPCYEMYGKGAIHLSRSLEMLAAQTWKNFEVVISDHSQSDLILDCVNFRYRKSILPVDCVIMAGGKGERLNPLTITTPKPLLKIGEKPIIEYNLDNFKRFGISKCWITINYLGDQIEAFASNKTNKDFEISTVTEPFSMGTIGSIKLIDTIEKDTVLVCNSDLLNDVNLEAFYLDFVDSEADLSVVTIPYNVNVPYAIMELQDEFVLNLKEKPNFTYYSNGGIYLFKKELLELIPKNSYFTAIDFMEKILESGLKIKSFAHNGYWLDIGKQEDYQRAKSDITKLNLFHD